MKARDLIRREYGASRNFITPRILGYGKLGRNVAYELSVGNAILQQGLMYGVSIVGEDDRGGTYRSFDFSQSFYSREEAIAYINGLKRGRMA